MTQVKDSGIQKIENITSLLREQNIYKVVSDTKSRTTLLLLTSMEKLIANMTNPESTKKDFDIPIKKCWKVGDIILIVIDKSIVHRLEINENDTFLEQKITDKGDMLMQIKRI